MSKPIFLWWAHKIMWHVLATNPKLSKENVLKRLREKFPKIRELQPYPAFDCFACESAILRESKKLEEWDSADCAIPNSRCDCCPLQWGDTLYVPDCCFSDALYQKWADAITLNNFKQAAEYAAKIRDLPLKENAHELYDVKESPNE